MNEPQLQPKVPTFTEICMMVALYNQDNADEPLIVLPRRSSDMIEVATDALRDARENTNQFTAKVMKEANAEDKRKARNAKKKASRTKKEN